MGYFFNGREIKGLWRIIILLIFILEYDNILKILKYKRGYGDGF